jgi:hypothetical protein
VSPRFFRYTEERNPDGSIGAVRTWRSLYYLLRCAPTSRLDRLRWWCRWQARTTWESLATIARHLVRAIRRADDGGGWTTLLERGAWVIRPCTGWRRVPYLTPPLASTRQYPPDDEEDHLDWACAHLGIS